MADTTHSRAAADAAIDAYAHKLGRPVRALASADDLTDTIVDLMADLLHHAHRAGIDTDGLLSNAEMHFNAERDEPRELTEDELSEGLLASADQFMIEPSPIPGRWHILRGGTFVRNEHGGPLLFASAMAAAAWVADQS